MRSVSIVIRDLSWYTVCCHGILYTVMAYCILSWYTVYCRGILYTVVVYCILSWYTVYCCGILYIVVVYCILLWYTVYCCGILYIVMVYCCSITCFYIFCNYIIFSAFNNLKTLIVQKSSLYVRQKLVIS
jgi:hypothetical protein